MCIPYAYETDFTTKALFLEMNQQPKLSVGRRFVALNSRFYVLLTERERNLLLIVNTRCCLEICSYTPSASYFK